MPFDLIAVDLDGTLLGGTKEGYGFLPEGIDALRQAVSKQTLITIATGRSIHFILELLERERVHYKAERWPHFIIADDCLVYNLRDETFEPNLDWNENIQRTERLYFENIRSGIEILIANQLSHISPDIHRANKQIEETRGYVEIKFPDESCARRSEGVITEWLSRMQLPYSAIRVRKYIFIRHSTVSKGNTLLALCKKLHIPIYKALAIGDSGNDLSMIDGRFGFIGAAPSNAEDEIKQAVHNQNGYVAKNHYGKGVAEIINTLFPLG